MAVEQSVLYHWLGSLSAALFLLTWFGLYQQIKAIESRRLAGLASTRSLSMNQFSSSYLAFYANFIFAIALEPFNHYLFWTRIGALLLVLFVIVRIWQERSSRKNQLIVAGSVGLLLLGLVSILYRPYPGIAQLGATSLMLIVTVILVQGTLHQCWLVYTNKTRGDLSATLFKSILIKDVSTLAFALTIPIEQAWPLLLLNGMSVVTRGLLLVLIRRY